MGKPSSQHGSKKSDTSVNVNTSSSKLQATLSTHKMDKMKRNKHNKTKEKINSLFKKLKRQSMQSLDRSQNDTVISLDSSEMDNTVIIIDSPDRPALKRKMSSISNGSSKRIKNDSLIINEDNPIINLNGSPNPVSPKRSNNKIECSTPINSKDSKTLQAMIIKNFSNNTNDKISEDIVNLTKEIHKDSYLTIDLTTESDINNTNNNIIDLDKSVQCSKNRNSSLSSVSRSSLSMSGDSDVTVLQNKGRKRNLEMNKFTKCIARLNSAEKGNLLELIAQNIFSGCQVPSEFKKHLDEIKSPPTEEDTYIKEVILGEVKSRNSIGSNIYHPSRDMKNKTGLRMIVIDGSNVAFEHTKGSRFSVKGLKICIDYFVRRGHVVKAFVPRFRCKYGKSTDPRLLDSLERQGLVVYTPSREIQGRTCVPYDDRYIVQCAAEFDGVIVSGDNYRDLLSENPRWRTVIENRLLPFTWVDDMIMFPRDPLGRYGPTLEQFLKHPNTQECSLFTNNKSVNPH